MCIYYLYKKTHNITGLQYLGYTKSVTPHRYKGSGKEWSEHIKLHGYNVTTEILLETSDKKEIARYGRFYSNLWDVVKSKEWANCIPETTSGGNGIFTEEARKKAHSIEAQKKRHATRIERGIPYNTTETIAKQVKTRIERGTLNTITPESILKRTETRKRNGSNSNNIKMICEHCQKTVGKPNYYRSHGLNCKKKSSLEIER